MSGRPFWFVTEISGFESVSCASCGVLSLHIARKPSQVSCVALWMGSIKFLGRCAP